MFPRISPLAATAVVAALLLVVAFLASPWIALLTVLIIRASTDISYSFLADATTPGGLLPALPNIVLILTLTGAGGLWALKTRRLQRLPVFPLLFLLLAGGFVGILRASGKLGALSEWIPLLGILVIYVLSANLPRSPRDIQRVINAILLSSILPAIMGLYQLATGEGIFLPEIQAVRINGSFVHPNPFGIYLVLLFGVLLARFVCGKGRPTWDIAILVVISSLLLGTFMRVAWVGAAAIVAIIGILRARWLLVVFPLLALTLVLTIPSVAARISDPVGAGGWDRLDLWTGTYREWHQATTEGVPALVAFVNLVGGLGPGAAEPLTARFRWKAFAAHNDYLRMLVEYGLFGVVIQLAIIVVLLRLGYTVYTELKGNQLDYVPLAFLAITVAYSIMSLTDNVFGATQNQVYYWTLAGLSSAAQRVTGAPSGRAGLLDRFDGQV